MLRISRFVSVLLIAAVTSGMLFAVTPDRFYPVGAVNTVRAAKDFDNSEVTEDNVLAFAKKYAPESYYILKESGDFMVWYQGEETVTGGIDTATHEQFHRMSFQKGDFDYSTGSYCEKYYAGNNKYYATSVSATFFLLTFNS